ncbi:MAG TPA: ABC transporter permease, partial [Tabrizicola sp.]
MTFQSLDSSPSVSVEVPPGAVLLRRGVRTARHALRRYGLLAGFLAVWQIGSTQGWINPTVFPPLDAILLALWQGLTSGALLDDIAISLQRSGIAFAAAVGLAIPLGLFMGQIRAVEQALDPILQFFRQTSALALYPVFILLLGLGEASKVF